MKFKEVNADIIDIIEYRRLGLSFRDWNAIKSFCKMGQTYFDLIVKKTTKN